MEMKRVVNVTGAVCGEKAVKRPNMAVFPSVFKRIQLFIERGKLLCVNGFKFQQKQLQSYQHQVLLKLFCKKC